MKRTVASRSFTLMALVLMAAVLLLPWGNPASAAVRGPACPHCAAVPPGVAAGPCCPQKMPGSDGAGGHTGKSCCRCATGAPALIAPQAVVSPTWQAATFLPSKVILALPLFPPNIFHPPECPLFPGV